jgi:hypothetical protein
MRLCSAAEGSWVLTTGEDHSIGFLYCDFKIVAEHAVLCKQPSLFPCISYIRPKAFSLGFACWELIRGECWICWARAAWGAAESASMGLLKRVRATPGHHAGKGAR